MQPASDAHPLHPVQRSATPSFFPTAEGSGLYLTNAWEIWVRYVFVFVSDAGCSYPWHGIHLLSILSACLAWLHFSDLLNGISLDLWPIPLLFCRVRHIRLLDFLPTCSNDLFGHDPVIFFLELCPLTPEIVFRIDFPPKSGIGYWCWPGRLIRLVTAQWFSMILGITDAPTHFSWLHSTIFENLFECYSFCDF